MRKPHRLVLLLATLSVLLGCPVPAMATPSLPPGMKPIPGAVVTAYDPPDDQWGAGHRGVDLEGEPGETVRAAADGVVTYAGVLAGRGVVVIDHGEVRTTYEPVAASVSVGDEVSRGDPIGALRAGHASCPGTTCLHWGLKEGDTYLDPMLLLGATIRLLPAAATPAAPVTAVSGGVSAGLARASGGVVLARPSGPVTSPYGMRRHPVTGVWKLHDGTDFGASCGTPMLAAASGTVVSRTTSAGYGNRLVVDHGAGASGTVRTSYNHAADFTVSPGDHVTQGQVIGHVGSTGSSTGCHLHFQVWLNGVLVDPMTVLR